MRSDTREEMLGHLLRPLLHCGLVPSREIMDRPTPVSLATAPQQSLSGRFMLKTDAWYIILKEALSQHHHIG
ncbi:hypothetical protein EMCRGX_G014871 [Ephydatia muelleri]